MPFILDSHTTTDDKLETLSGVLHERFGKSSDRNVMESLEGVCSLKVIKDSISKRGFAGLNPFDYLYI